MFVSCEEANRSLDSVGNGLNLLIFEGGAPIIWAIGGIVRLPLTGPKQVSGSISEILGHS